MSPSNERGAIATWVAASLVGFVIAVGIGVDLAGQSAAATRARAIAGQAARAAGQQVVIDNGSFVLDPIRARRAASTFIASTDLDGAASITTSRIVRVDIHDRYHTQFLSIIGITTIPIHASASAEAQTRPGGQP